MNELLGYLTIGVTVGCVYAALALALVLIYRTTGVLNFAQGELATLTTYVVWQLLAWGAGYTVAILVGLVIAGLIGAVVYFAVIRPVDRADEMSVLIVTVGLFVGVNALTGLIWSTLIRPFESPFGSESIAITGINVPINSLGTLGVLILVVLALAFLLSRTRFGLALRAITSNKQSASQCGVRVFRYLAFGWALACMVGLIAGVLAAPVVSLQPQMMINALIYAFAGAVLGGLDSPAGAVVGGFAVGIASTLAIGYFPTFGSTLNIAVPLIAIYAVLMLRPQGIFGRARLERV